MRRPRLVVVIGVWMLCFPSFIVAALIIVDIVSNSRDREHLVVFWLAAITLFVTAFMLYRITRNFVTIPPPESQDEGA